MGPHAVKLSGDQSVYEAKTGVTLETLNVGWTRRQTAVGLMIDSMTYRLIKCGPSFLRMDLNGMSR